jgi:3-isopropylmalate/(R)-2-methylmalate dehydratase large subunit
MKSAQTLVEKIWHAHVVESIPNGPDVLYIDKHLIHEVTSPQAFAGLEARKQNLFRPERTLATADHNVPSCNQHLPISDPLSRIQVNTLTENCKQHRVMYYGMEHPLQGIVHVIAPEQGITLPGMTIVCGDSHTSTHGGLGALAFGIGSSEVEQVFASQCLLQVKPKTMRMVINGILAQEVSAKDLILFILSKSGTAIATGYFIEYTGAAIRALSIEQRMTICNMSIELGARGGIIAPDQTTFDYVFGKPQSPRGTKWTKALEYWKTLYSDADATFDETLHFDISSLHPMISYGTNPGMSLPLGGNIPVLPDTAGKQALDYMGWHSGEAILGKKISHVFIGSCTNSRMEDLRAAAALVSGKKIAAHVTAFVVPGSREVRRQAIQEGLDVIFTEAGFSFREPGCSACLGMNEDKIPAGAYCVSTSNRNFEGRQGPGARTLLASPRTAAAAALAGCIVDYRNEPSIQHKQINVVIQ